MLLQRVADAEISFTPELRGCIGQQPPHLAGAGVPSALAEMLVWYKRGALGRRNYVHHIFGIEQTVMQSKLSDRIEVCDCLAYTYLLQSAERHRLKGEPNPSGAMILKRRLDVLPYCAEFGDSIIFYSIP